VDTTATHTWLHNPTTGGVWQCPNAAVDDYLALGWERSEAPSPPNPAIAERLAWRRQQAAAAQAEPDPVSQPAAQRGKTEE